MTERCLRGDRANVLQADVPAGRMNNVSDDGDTGQPGGPPRVASIAAHRARRSYPGPGPADPASPMPADLGDLQAEIRPSPDGSDVLRRLEHANAGSEVIARLGEVMARITADDPATAAFWASLAGHQPRQDAPKRPGSVEPAG
jgi:hypothetical protein